MKNLYKKIARAIFMHAFYDELVEIGKEIKTVKSKIVVSSDDYSKVSRAIGKLEVLEKLDLLS